jgi:hypothetical protein
MRFAGWILLVFFVAGATTALSDEFDERKPYGRVFISVMDASGAERPLDKTDATANPKDGALIARVQGSKPCFIVVAAFDSESGGILTGWPPQFAEIRGDWDIAILPKTPIRLRSPPHPEFEFYALFLSPGAPAVADIRKLVTIMQKPGADQNVIKLQAAKLRELISGAMADSDRSHFVARRTKTQIAATLRGGSGSAEWIPLASRVNFSDQQPGLLIFPSGKSQ